MFNNALGVVATDSGFRNIANGQPDTNGILVNPRYITVCSALTNLP
jgi:hypothetical protein